MKTKPLFVEISPGELFDKITVLQVKTERIRNEAKLRNVRSELEMLERVREQAIEHSAALGELVAELKAVNAELYDTIDAIYRCEKAKEIGATFVELARSVYRHNDRRALLKRQINILLSSELLEEKGHELNG